MGDSMHSIDYYKNKYCKNCNKKDCTKNNLQIFNCAVGKIAELEAENNAL